ncbi:MAG TPA: bifunctional diguanylate cyclase/phosphodiesterase [Candidatus Lachnoclostridium stercorigallinarum]|uniref:Bifunctional diguanylate cyclase/phosphodiesterase n=1 Tax=Candidatus Lachnoclostridium stercorigallinarum TaxID=2838634 RepID=A0A9D2K571_9FIRM|nr:bifunctional diguanylate cyclase/phosphodiesterase [Candidatus Lachnoclostridium stercorigallinarum]
MMGWLQKEKKPARREKAGAGEIHRRTAEHHKAEEHRKADDRASGSAGETAEDAGHYSAGDGGEICRRRLDTLLQSVGGASRGVIMKLHLENFKQLNEILGYDYCQNLLSQIISYLESVTGSTVHRYIGVEFLVFLRRHSVSQASDLAEEILEQFGRVWKVNGTDCLCTVQIGLCPYPGYADTADEMMKLLDMALNRAADMGPNQYVLYDSQMQADFIRRQTIAKHLQNAVEQREVEIRYRPVYNIETKRFIRGEFDMRIFIPGIGMVGAPEFLPIAEDSGQIRAVEYYALEQVGTCIRRLLDADREFDSIALPVSSILLLQEDFTYQVRTLMDTWQIPAGRLALELPEEVFTMGNLNVSSTLQELSSMGVELILDNFGSGLSSVTGLLDLSVNTLKLDRMLLWQLETNPKAAAVINGLVKTARDLGLNVIAEGVETALQLDVLNAAGCTFQQGFYYSPAVGEDTMARILGTDLNSSLPVIEQEKLQLRR